LQTKELAKTRENAMVLAGKEGALHLKFWSDTSPPTQGVTTYTMCTKACAQCTRACTSCTRQGTPEGMTCPLAHQVREHLFPSSAVSLAEQKRLRPWQAEGFIRHATALAKKRAPGDYVEWSRSWVDALRRASLHKRETCL
jgi:hypothetical protein